MGQILLTIKTDELCDIFGGLFIDLSAAIARIDKGSQTDRCNCSGFVGRNVAVHVRDHTLGQIVGDNFIFDRQPLKPGNQAPVTPDHPFLFLLAPPANRKAMDGDFFFRLHFLSDSWVTSTNLQFSIFNHFLARAAGLPELHHRQQRFSLD